MSIGNILKHVAPWLATAMTGPMGGLAVEAIGNALGLSDKTEASIKAALGGVTHDQMLALKNADQDFKVKIQELGYANIEKLAALAVENTNGARQMQISVRSYIPPTLAIMITLGFFGILTLMIFGIVPNEVSQALLVMLGILGSGFKDVMNFYFSSTAESAKKTELLARAEPIK